MLFQNVESVLNNSELALIDLRVGRRENRKGFNQAIETTNTSSRLFGCLLRNAPASTLMSNSI
jgi:hypothetical protein